MSSQATFMGLPPELRLRIYDYVLDPHIDQGFDSKLDGHARGTCCAQTQRPDARRCECATAEISLAVLRVCKVGARMKHTEWLIVFDSLQQVFDEAMPILCNNSVLRFRMPEWNVLDVTGPDFGDSKVALFFKSLPSYALPHMQQLLITGVSDMNRSCCIPCYLLQTYCFLKGYWDIISRQMPNLHKLRLHFDLSVHEYESFYRFLPHFKEATKLKHLRDVTIELHLKRDSYLPAWTPAFTVQQSERLTKKFTELFDSTTVKLKANVIQKQGR